MAQQARNLAWKLQDGVVQARHLLRNRDCKFIAAFDQVVSSEGMKVVRLAYRSPRAKLHRGEIRGHLPPGSARPPGHLQSRSPGGCAKEFLVHYHQARPLETSAGPGPPAGADPVDLTAIARDTCLDAGAVAPGRSITLDGGAAVMVAGDEMRLRQVVANLVRNALVHTPSRSPIEVSVARKNGSAFLTVADHGPGLIAGDGARVFEAFHRSDPGRSRDRGGSGSGAFDRGRGGRGASG